MPAKRLLMNLPDHSDDNLPILSAADMLAYRWRAGRAPKSPPPQTVIVCYQRDPIATLLKRYRTTRVEGFLGELRVLKTKRNAIGVLHSIGPGAPIVAATVEELIAFGVKQFIAIGLAGSLQPDLFPGDVVICDRALRDEGTSPHYLPPARSVEADPVSTQRLSEALSRHGIAHTIGSSWTTDAPYRETRHEVEAYRADGVKTVEMEAAALFAVGQSLNVQAAAVLVIGDRLADLSWQPAADPQPLRHSLSRVIEATVDWLSRE